MLSIGDTLVLETVNEQGEKEVYRTKVMDIHEHSFFISPPVREESNRTEPIIPIDTYFQAQFVAHDQKVYTFHTKVLQKYLENIATFELELPSKDEFIQIQRRSFIRVNTQLKVKVFSISHEFSPFDTYTTDISAGGLNLVLPDNIKLKKDQVIMCSFILPLKNEEIFLQLNCVVVRTSEKNSKHFASLKFEKISEKERQFLVQYCFQRQLDLRKKGSNLL